jgi:Zinc-finger of C2H2 type
LHVAYINKKIGDDGKLKYQCLLCNTICMSEFTAQLHFNGEKHKQMYNNVRQLETDESRFRSESNSWKKFQDRVRIVNSLQKLTEQIRYPPWKIKIKDLCILYLQDEKKYYGDYNLLTIVKLLFKYIYLEKIAVLKLAILNSFLLPSERCRRRLDFATDQHHDETGVTGSSTRIDWMFVTGSQVIIPLVLQFVGLITIPVWTMTDKSTLKELLTNDPDKFERAMYCEKIQNT